MLIDQTRGLCVLCTHVFCARVQALESECAAVEAALRDRRTPRARLLEAKDAVAQLNGSLEKLQYVGVDSIITADLDSGKELAKEKVSWNTRQ